MLAGAEIFGLYAPSGWGGGGGAGGVGPQWVLHPGGDLPGLPVPGGLTDGMRYAASAILTYSVAFAFYDTKAYRRVWFMPAIAIFAVRPDGDRHPRGPGVARGGHGVLCHGGPVHRGGGLWLPGGVHPVAGDFGRPARPLAPADHRPAVAGEYALMSLARVEILATFSLGRLVAAVGILWAARRGVTGGGLLGACAGVALDLASGEQPYYSLVFTLAGLLCGLCRDRRKGWAALVYVLACSVAVLWSWDGGRHMGLPLEALVGAILFLVLPSACPRGIRPPCPPRTQTGRPAARPSPGRWRRWPGPSTPSTAA